MTKLFRMRHARSTEELLLKIKAAIEHILLTFLLMMF